MKEKIFFVCTFLTASVLFAKEFFQEAEAQINTIRLSEQLREDCSIKECEKNEEKPTFAPSFVYEEERFYQGK